jgi:ATP-dependent helicase/nuclease subunit A
MAQTCFDVPLVVEAGAGTGKTSVLVARVVAWALGSGWERAARSGGQRDERALAARVLRRIVAITFTEAAAAEMGQRVASALRDIQLGGTPVGVDASALRCEPAARVARATALRAAIDQLRVHTIHAFCRRLLAESPLELGLHPAFEVDADETAQQAVLREVLSNALPELFASSTAMLRLVAAGQGPAEIEDALLVLLRAGAPRDALFGEAATDADAERLLAALERAVDAFVACERGRLAAVTRARKVAETAQHVAALRVRLAEAAPRDMAALEAVIAWLSEAGLDRERVHAFAKGELTQSGAAAIGDDAEALAAAAGALAPLLDHVAGLDPGLLRAGREVLGPLYARAFDLLRARGVQSFSALLRDARALVERPAVAARLRAEIDQLLVDEVQDTDPMQCDLIRALALAGDRERRPALFLVGDPKQSIYGWRSADLLAYQQLADDVVAAGGRVLSLVVNHRSAPCILEEVSRVVRPVMKPRRGLQPEFQVLLASESRQDDSGYDACGCAPVEHWVSCDIDPVTRAERDTRRGDAAAIEARAVAAEIARLHDAGEAWGDFGLLLRASTDLETYLDALRRAAVPFAVDGDRRYYQRREIIDVCALVRCVLDRNDLLALLTVLRSPMAGVPDAALLPLWSRGLPALASRLDARAPSAREDDAALSALLSAVAGELSYSNDPVLADLQGWSESTLATLRAIGALRASFDDDPVDVFVERLRTLTMCEVTESLRYLGAYRVANLDRCFRDLLAALEAPDACAHALLRALRSDVAGAREREEGRPRDAETDAVHVMTIHKAKGLAFEHVYLLQTHKRARLLREARVEPWEGRYEYSLLGAQTLGHHEVLARREEVERCERVRTLYVALTRARRRLVIAGLPDDGESHAALIAKRELCLASVADVLAGASDALHVRGARTVLPALRPRPTARAAEHRAAIFEPTVVRAMSQRLSERRRGALRERGRTWSAPLSAASHEALAAERESSAGAEERAGASRSAREGSSAAVAGEVGTAIHRVLEHLDLTRDLRAALEDARADAEARLRRTLEPARADAAVRLCHEIVDGLARGPLFERLRAIAPHIVARELPVLLPPAALAAGPSSPGASSPGASSPGPWGEPSHGATMPAGYLSGSVDFVYRDPESGAFVVGDWKTDRVGDEASQGARAAAYAMQGAGYVRAVQDALALPSPPRFELWMLAEGVVKTVG